MRLLEDLKLDTWWGITLYLGVGLVVSSMFFTPEFITSKNLFGLGAGMALVGLSHAIANKHAVLPVFGGYWQWTVIKHSFPTLIIFLIGLVFCVVFGIKIFWELL